MKDPKGIALALLLAFFLLVLGAGLSWLYYADGASHYIALAIAWPLLLGAKVGKGGVAIAIAFGIYFALSLLSLVVARRAIRIWG